jgi:hypothetical protein
MASAVLLMLLRLPSPFPLLNVIASEKESASVWDNHKNAGRQRSLPAYTSSPLLWRYQLRRLVGKVPHVVGSEIEGVAALVLAFIILFEGGKKEPGKLLAVSLLLIPCPAPSDLGAEC